MADESTTPLLDRASSSRHVSPHSSSPPESFHSVRSTPPKRSRSFQLSSESTPLLQRREEDLPRYVTEARERSLSPASRDPLSVTPAKGRSRWPTFVALACLTAAVLLTLAFGFVAPAAVKEYAEEAAVFRPQKVSLDSATLSGVRARVQGEFFLDSSRVPAKSVRDLGRLATWIAREIETGETDVQVYLPEDGNVLLGTASLPPLKLNIRDGYVNQVDVLTDLQLGDVGRIRRVANDWLEGRLGQLQIKGTATVSLKSGLLDLGTQVISDTLAFDDHDIPKLPAVNVTKLNVHDKEISPGKHAMAVDVSVSVSNDYALQLAVPPLGFDILVPNCSPGDPYILVANATTDIVDVQPQRDAVVDVRGLIHKLPAELTTACPGKKDSPLDVIVANYIQGLQTTIYVRGADAPSPDTPSWIVDLMKSVTVPVPITGNEFGQLIKNFSMTNVHFSLPDPLAEPDTPESRPTVSALVKVFINLPKQMNFAVDIPRVRANADVYYKGDKLGFLDLSEWQPANTSRISDTSSDHPLLLVTFDIKDGPLQVTDDDVFTEVVQALLFGKESVELSVDAVVDGEVRTALGRFVVHDIPAQGEIKVKPPFRSISAIDPRVESVEVLHSSESTLLLNATINFTNPTQYSAHIPFVDTLLLYNGTAVAHLTARNLSVVPGVNAGVNIEALWNPLDCSGGAGVTAGREFISHYISGFNTTVTLQSHKGSIPALPNLGQALSTIRIDIPVPKLPIPGNDDDGEPGGDDDGKPRFIKDATLHVWSSTAVFTLLSPLPRTTIYITDIDAVALYNHTEPVGTINYIYPFAVPPGISQTPRLPVDLDFNGVGYDAVLRALGGTLEMDAKAKVGVRIGEYRTVILYQGKGIGARIRI
ncbi:hypothetical protein VTN77DRAFT_1195 [Rasamsonia byssochlamydoides]|uniref:uncharacterized protein n=1 Tax=Rasamsonia byssochlamydoides TaxID=89139 RepID=UPI003741F3E8